MERSMVQELSGMNSSQFLSNRSTFISTALNEGDFQLRKSRIQNLPSYKKQDLSSRINFVVVFQAIEIQRLSAQVEALRIAMKDEQRQMFNIKNYQVQIRELTQKCFEYERQIVQYHDETEKLNLICQKLYEELEQMKSRFSDIDPTIKEKFRLQKQRNQRLQEEVRKWTQRYTALENSKNREMQDMRLMMESQRKSMIDRQMNELSLRFNSQRQNLQKQIKKLRENIQSKSFELQRANEKISQLQIVNQELRQYERTIDEYQNKFALISQETVRLNQLLRHKQQQIDRLNSLQGNYKRRIAELERKVVETEEGGQKVRALQNQMRDWKTRYSKLQDQNRQYKQQIDKIPQFKQAIQQINNQTQKLRDGIRQKLGQVDDWKGRYQKVQSQLRNTKEQQETKLPVLQNKVNQLITQNDRINNALKSRTGEVQNWKNKYNDIQRQISRFSNVQQEKKNLQNQLNGQIRQINDLQGNIKQLQAQARRLGDVQRDLNNQRAQKQECRKQIDRLNNAVRASAEKNDNFEKRCMNLQRDLKTFTQISEQLQIYKQKQINLTRQIDRINGIISQKIKQIQALKQTFQRLEKGLSQYQGVQKKLMDSVNQTQKLIRDLDESRKQNGVLQDKLVGVQSQGRKLKNDVLMLTQQKQQIVRLVNTRTQQLEQSRMQISQFQMQITQLRQKQARLKQVQEKIRITQNNLNQLDRRYKAQQNRSRELNQSLQQTVGQLNKIKRQGMMSPQFKQQFATLKIQSEQRQRQIRTLQQRIQTIEGILRKLKEVIIRQDQITKSNSQKFVVMAKKFDTNAQAFKRMFDLQNQILKLNEENLALQSKLRMMSVQNEGLKRSYNTKGVGQWGSQNEVPPSPSPSSNSLNYRKQDSFSSGKFSAGSTINQKKTDSFNSTQFEVPFAKISSNSSNNTNFGPTGYTTVTTRTTNFSGPGALTPNYGVPSLNNMGVMGVGMGATGMGTTGNYGNIGGGITGNLGSAGSIGNTGSTGSMGSTGSIGSMGGIGMSGMSGMGGMGGMGVQNSGYSNMQGNYSYGIGGQGMNQVINPGSQTNLSSVSTTKTQSYVNLDAFKKPSIPEMQQQYQSQTNRFQFKTSSNNREF